MSRAAVLIVEDESHVAAFTQKCLESMGYEVTGIASNADLAFKSASVRKPDLVLMDIGLDGPMDGADTAREMHVQYNLPVVFLTGSADERTLERAKQAEPLAYILKPFEPKDLQATIETAIHLFRTSRSHAAEAVRRVEDKYRAIFENATIGIFQITPTGQVLTANPAMARMLGYDNSLDMMISCVDLPTGLLPDESRRLELVSLLDGNAVMRNHETQFRSKDGGRLWVALNIHHVRDEGGRLLYYEGIAQDITQRKNAERERDTMEVMLRQSQKLEAIGRLAAGIAHEINTPIQYVGDNTRFLGDGFRELDKVVGAFERLLEAQRPDLVASEVISGVESAIQSADLEYLREEIPRAIEQTLEGVERVASIVRAMKEFSHHGSQEKTPTDLRRSIESTLVVCRNEYKYVADVETDFDPDLPLVDSLPCDVNQVILNLIVNAAHAIAEGIGPDPSRKGLIRIVTRCDGDWAEIRISDNGAGIPASVRHKIFDPFFTTKEVGKGTGQGLAIAHAVVTRKHGGVIDFESEEGSGTTFRIRLPIKAAEDY